MTRLPVVPGVPRVARTPLHLAGGTRDQVKRLRRHHDVSSDETFGLTSNVPIGKECATFSSGKTHWYPADYLASIPSGLFLTDF